MRRGRDTHIVRALAIAGAAIALAALAAAPATASAKQRPLGIDVSRFQGTIDWSAVRDSGVRFAFVQASRGTGADCDVVPDDCGPDAYYASNYAAARAEGIRVGPYHRVFIDPEPIEALKADARLEADTFTAVVGRLNRGDLLPALDVESPFDGASPVQVRVWLKTWIKRMRKTLKVKPIIYTNTTSWAATGNTSKFALKGYPLWVANWGVKSPSVPASNWAGRGWAVWQYTSSGSVPGISGRVDMNRLRVRFRKISVG
jgi:GH25 family lysozyme M1 (1,4-beta-N-acetylmuramidase)